jgi:hypothetical protein
MKIDEAIVKLAAVLRRACSEHGVPNRFSPGELEGDLFCGVSRMVIGRIGKQYLRHLNAALRSSGYTVHGYVAGGFDMVEADDKRPCPRCGHRFDYTGRRVLPAERYDTNERTACPTCGGRVVAEYDRTEGAWAWAAR